MTVWCPSGSSVCGGSVRGGNVCGGSVRVGSVCGGSVRGGCVCGGSVRGGSVCGGSVRGWLGGVGRDVTEKHVLTTVKEGIMLHTLKRAGGSVIVHL